MQFKEGTHLFTADGTDVGSIERVVLDPRTKNVTDVVIRQGVLFTEDKVVPIEFIVSADENGATLKRAVGNLLELPLFEEVNYVPIDTTYPAGDVTPLYGYPPAGMGWWHYPVRPYAIEVERNIPENTVPLKEGATVISADDKHVGNVDRVFMESQADRATHLVISQGLVFKERKLIPTSWITEIAEDKVHLMVESAFIARLPDYHD
jgi:uncharacterized protein YrrD